MMPARITICICTYKRPHMLQRLLNSLAMQETAGLLEYSVVVVDNDREESAKTTAASAPLPVDYHVEPRQGIALARNKAVENATGDYVAFIDDDEFPVQNWLMLLLKTLREHSADGVLGPVNPHYDEAAPEWVIRGKFYERPELPTGVQLAWPQCRTGNVLLRRQLFEENQPAFRPEFQSGEDQDFFRRMIEKGHRFVWCSEAIAYEVVPPIRWTRGFLVRRAMQRGVYSFKNRPTARAVAESLVAVPAYAAALPIGLLLGQSRFMTFVFKLSYFSGRLLAAVGINPVGRTYVTE